MIRISTLCCTAIVALAAISPVASLLRNGLLGVVFYLLGLAGLVAVLFRARLADRFAALDPAGPSLRPLAWGAVAFLGMTVVILALHSLGISSGQEKSLRFALMALLVWLFVLVPPVRLRQVQWGLVLIVLVMSIQVLYLSESFDGRPDTTLLSRYNAVGFGNLLLLFSVLLTYSMGWRLTPYPRAEIALKFAVAVLGLCGFALSATRTGWMAVPAFLLIGLYLMRGQSLRVYIWLLAGLLAASVLAMTVSSTLLHRLSEVATEAQSCTKGEPEDTSVCIRMQLAEASWSMFKRHPWIGVGDREGFLTELAELQRQGVVTKRVASSFGEPHNDLVYYLAVYGAPGFLAALAFIYLLPGWYFVRLIRQSDAQRRTAAAMGLAVCVGFFTFGLTEMMFRGMRTASLYAIWVAVLLALALPRRDGK